jgi:hypothetical protein
VFGGQAADAAPPVDLKVLHAKIGELTLENDFLSGALSKAGLAVATRRVFFVSGFSWRSGRTRKVCLLGQKAPP